MVLERVLEKAALICFIKMSNIDLTIFISLWIRLLWPLSRKKIDEEPKKKKKSAAGSYDATTAVSNGNSYSEKVIKW